MSVAQRARSRHVFCHFALKEVPVNPASKLRTLLSRPGPIVIAGAHNGLSAKLAEQAGFDGVWASGFEISAAYGIPDANILTMADNLEIARQMVDAVQVPIVADCDNGYGNAVNVIHMVRHYEAAGIAAVCIEDNVFPKRCSFYAGVERELASIEEHAGKIRAAKDAQRSSDFCVIARTEALIAGWGEEEALTRARAYAEAGADMILIHSKAKGPDEIMAFAKAWDRKTPLVCVPTTYKTTSVTDLDKGGFKLIIFANHGLRSALKAMRETYTTLRKNGVGSSVDHMVVPLNDVYDIVGVNKMRDEEKTYMPAGVDRTTGVILAAGNEQSIGPLTENTPRAMLDIRGKSILQRQIDALNRCNIKDVAVVRGYKKEMIDAPNIRAYDNDEFATTGEVVSLFKAAAELDRRVVIVYGDILFEQSVLEKLLRSPADITVVVDRSLTDRPPDQQAARVRDYVAVDVPQVDGGHRFVASEETRRVRRIGSKIDPREANGEFAGMVMLSERGCRLLREAWLRATEQRPGSKFHEALEIKKATLTDLLQEVINSGAAVNAVDIYKGWMEIDTFEDYQRAWASLR
jgi:phosphoenolpyruvate phosphomutase